MRDVPTLSPHPPSVLIVSNGHGEDAVGRAVADALISVAKVVAYPLVGRGESYGPIPLLDSPHEFPSGGFALRGSWRGLWADLAAGAARYWLHQRRILAWYRGQHDMTIVVGDVYCLWMAARPHAQAVFVATAKSEYNEPYRTLERQLIRRRARVVYARDVRTAEVFASRHIPARFVGNPLMDTVHFTGEALPLRSGRPTVTLLPGSRPDAYENIPPLLQVCAAVGRKQDVNWLCTVASTLKTDMVKRVAGVEGWSTTNGILQRDRITVALTRAFGDAVLAADVVIGLAGTANEQAAGLGKPVVAFPGHGSQFSRRFLALQGRLLGDVLVATPRWQDAAEALLRLLQDPEDRMRRGQIGRARMGPGGAIRTIAGDVRTWLLTSPSRRQARGGG